MEHSCTESPSGAGAPATCACLLLCSLVILWPTGGVLGFLWNKNTMSYCLSLLTLSFSSTVIIQTLMPHLAWAIIFCKLFWSILITYLLCLPGFSPRVLARTLDPAYWEGDPNLINCFLPNLLSTPFWCISYQIQSYKHLPVSCWLNVVRSSNSLCP